MSKPSPESEPGDDLITDAEARQRMGGVTRMTSHTWDKYPDRAPPDWPAPIYINGRKHRSRRGLDRCIEGLVRRAVAERGKRRTEEPTAA
jgi:hypothetical protein